jgi:hypothetical protein
VIVCKGRAINGICCLSTRKPKIEICRTRDIDTLKVIVAVKIITGMWESRHALLLVYY